VAFRERGKASFSDPQRNATQRVPYSVARGFITANTPPFDELARELVTASLG
jgi:hypothetical protein